MPKQPKRPRTQTRFDPQRTHPPETIELVDPAWILKALALMLGLGLLGGYLTLCVVFSHSQWQLVLHPSRTVATTPAAIGLPFQEVHFGHDGVAATEPPQLDGWWIPSDTPSAATALLLHGGDGSMSDALAQARTLHDARLNVLLFDYRGYGRSLGAHPTQDSMRQDAESALTYLTRDRSISLGRVLLYGTGVGGSDAVQLCAAHPANTLPAIILESAEGDLAARAGADPRSKAVPFRLLFHEDFPLAAPLRTLATPKLLLTHTNGNTPLIFQQAADPKMTVELPPNDQGAELSSLNRFLSTYIQRPPQSLTPNP
jgi:pimeloyl-ACP methyl ester carboxylesterase